MNQKQLRSSQVSENKFQQEMNFFKLKIITIPKQIQNFHYYSKQSLLIETHLVNCYSVVADQIIYNQELTQNINSQCNQKIKDQTLYLDNHLVVRSQSNLFKFNLDSGKHEKLTSVSLIKDIYHYKQINRKSFITQGWGDLRFRIIFLKNFKIQNTISPKFQIDSMTYINHMVQARTYQGVYYFFNIQMTKQIKKYSGFSKHNTDYIHISSNYLFVPVYIEINAQPRQTHIKIYDICNFKLKGTIEVKNRKDRVQNFILMRNFNILAFYYPNKSIDLYDFNTFQFQRSVKLNGDYRSQLKHDKENGLILFQMRDIYN